MTKAPQALCIASLLCACEPRTLYLDASCYAFAPIVASRQDTAITKRQILTHNQTHHALCAAGFRERVQSARNF